MFHKVSGHEVKMQCKSLTSTFDEARDCGVWSYPTRPVASTRSEACCKGHSQAPAISLTKRHEYSLK
jgi:hypothetical protein